QISIQAKPNLAPAAFNARSRTAYCPTTVSAGRLVTWQLRKRSAQPNDCPHRPAPTRTRKMLYLARGGSAALADWANGPQAQCLITHIPFCDNGFSCHGFPSEEICRYAYNLKAGEAYQAKSTGMPEFQRGITTS